MGKKASKQTNNQNKTPATRAPSMNLIDNIMSINVAHATPISLIAWIAVSSIYHNQFQFIVSEKLYTVLQI